jgi:hypothetical protein
VSSVVIVEKDIDVIVRTGHPKKIMPNPCLIIGHGLKNDGGILLVPKLACAGGCYSFRAAQPSDVYLHHLGLEVFTSPVGDCFLPHCDV